jgi:Ca2+-binding RTX toxin-like protein
MATFTLTTDPGAAYIGTEGDDTFIIPSYEAWIAAGRVIDGRGGTDTLDFRFAPPAPGVNQVVDADFAGVANMESITWNPPGGSPILGSNLSLTVTMAALASLSFARGLTLGFNNPSVKGAGLTVPVIAANTKIAVETGSGNDVITGFVAVANASTGGGDDVVNFGGAGLGVSPFSGGGFLDGGPGYDILKGLGPANNNTSWVTATSAALVSGFEEIWVTSRFDLLVDTPTALTGLDVNGDRNPLVLRLSPFVSVMQVFASNDGRPSYNGRITAYGGAGNDTVRGSSVSDLLDGGSGGADFLSGEGGDDRIVVQNAAHAAASTIAGGAGYDILAITDANQPLNNAVFSRGSGIEEIWGDGIFTLTAATPTALTGVDGAGTRNPLVLRPYNGTFFNVVAADTGAGAYDGRLIVYGTAGNEAVRGSSTGDLLDGGSEGADSLSGEGGNDWLVFQNAGHLGATAGVAGGAGYDILALKDAAQTVTDAAFAKAQGIEELRFLGTGAQSVTFGANSDAAFAASSFGAGSVSAANALSLHVNAAGTTRALSLYGTSFSDTLIGGEGADYIDIGRGYDTVRAGGGADHVYIVSGSVFMVPGVYTTPIDGGAGYDVLLLDDATPGSFPNTFASLFVSALGSTTPINGPIRNFEELRLLGSRDQVLSLTLQQIFAGSEIGYATITAPNAASLRADLTGFTMGASVYGTAGADTFTAGVGRDYLVGGTGADRFNFAPGCSVDVIADFASGSDRIGLSGFAGITDFAAIQARASVVGGNLQIGLSPTDAIILAGVTSIAVGDFLFG